MKRFALAFVSVLVAACLLTGCGDDYPLGQTITYEDLQITLPGDFIDLSKEAYAEDADFLYGRNTLILKAMAEKKAALQEMSLDTYISWVIKGNELSCAPEVFRDGYLFSYETPVGNENYTYTTAVFEGKTNFWLLQFYCPSANLTENQPEMDMILSAVQLQN
jgi:hypothetical protein